MAYDYSRIRSTAHRLIGKYGRTATLVRKSSTGPEYDPVITKTEYDVTAVRSKERIVSRDGATLNLSMDTVLISPNGVEPLKGDTIIFAGKMAVITDFGIISPDGTDLLYKAYLEGGWSDADPVIPPTPPNPSTSAFSSGFSSGFS